MVSALEAALALAEGEMALNLSGANVAQAAYALAWARDAEVPVFVVQPDTDQLLWLHAPAHFQSFNVADRLTLEGYFNTFGIEVISTGGRLHSRDAQMDGFLRRWLSMVLRLPENVSALRRMLQGKACGDLLPGSLDNEIKQLLGSLVDAGMVEQMPDGCLRLIRADAVGFLSGGWLEHYVLMELQEVALQLPLQDAALGLRLQAENGARCEFDIAILFNNALFIVECKTGMSITTPPLQSIYKLDSLTSQAGLDAEALLASLAQVSGNDRARADWHGIALAAASELVSLKPKLIRWLQSYAGLPRVDPSAPGRRCSS